MALLNGELPRWQCHKVVRAALIEEIVRNGDHGAVSILKLHGGATFMTDTSWTARHNAEVGGYLVVYEDGYTSFSPAKAFEDGYSPITQGARHE